MDAERKAAEEKFQSLGIAPEDLKFAKDASIDGVVLNKDKDSML